MPRKSTKKTEAEAGEVTAKKPLKKTVYIKPEIEKKITILDEIHEFKFDPKKNKTAKKIKID
jgi:hypothetical protein